MRRDVCGVEDGDGMYLILVMDGEAKKNVSL